MAAILAAWPYWGIVLLLAGVYVFLIEPFWFRVRRVRIPVAHAGCPHFTILQISDLHFYRYERARIRFLQSLKTLDADVIAYTGDLVEYHGRRETLWEAVSGLVGRVGSFAVFGNHDHVRYSFRELFYDPSKCGHDKLEWADVNSLAAGLQARGIEPLSNAHKTVEIAGQKILFVGVDDPFVRKDDIDRAFADAPSGLPTVVLCHTPEPKMIEELSRRGAHLILSGHTHGGQIRLPFNIAPVRRCGIDRQRCLGLSKWGDTWLNVSGGIGVTPITHMRFLCRPEAVLIEVGGKE